MKTLTAIIALFQVQFALAIELGQPALRTFTPEMWEEYGNDITVDDHCCLFALDTGLEGKSEKFCFDSSDLGQEVWSLATGFGFSGNFTT